MTSPSTSTSSPSVVVTPDELARALDKMGLTEAVSAASLYDTILQLRSKTVPSPPQPPQTTPDPPQVQCSQIIAFFTLRKYVTNSSGGQDSQKDQGFADQPRHINTGGPSLDFYDPVRAEKRRIMRESVKAQYPNGPPPLIGLYGDKWSGGGTDVRGNHGISE